MTTHTNYLISGTLNLNPNPNYANPDLEPDFQKNLTKFKKLIKNLVSKKANKTFMKFGDGDYYFLKQIHYGSATPGSGALMTDYANININVFKKGMVKNDYIACEIYKENRDMWHELFPDRKIDFPAEFIYGLFYSKWFFKNFNGRIGIIGAKEKLDVIKELMNNKEYRDFLGLKRFEDYIYFPQKGAADDVDKTERIVAKQLVKATSDIFILGLGHAKSAVLYRFKTYKKAVYLDVGSGIDGLAGCIDPLRPYAGDWVNYKLIDYDYSKVHEDYTRYQGQGKHRFLGHKNDFIAEIESIKNSKLAKSYNSLILYNDLFAKYKNRSAKIFLVVTSGDDFIPALKKYLPDANVAMITDEDMKKSDLINFAKAQGPYDVIIDSGNPFTNRQVNTFIALFPLLNNRGNYILENVYSSYWPKYGGRLYGQSSAIEVIKTMVDRINWQAYRSEMAGEARVKGDQLDYFEKTVSGIHFYNDLVVVEKSDNTHPKIYKDGLVMDRVYE